MLLSSRAGLQITAAVASLAAAATHLHPPPDVILLHTNGLANGLAKGLAKQQDKAQDNWQDQGQDNAQGESALETEALLAEVPALARHAPVLILTSRRELELHYRTFGEIINQGVKGIVFREDSSETLFQAIATLHAGGVWLGPSTLARVLGKMLHVKRTQTTDPERRKAARLTQREREIIVLLCQGRKNKQIAQQLNLSEATVRHYLTSVFGKLAVTDRLELAIYAYRHGLQHLPAAEPNAAGETPRQT